MTARIIAILCFFLLGLQSLRAQVTNVRCKWVVVDSSKPFLLDTTSVLPSSINVTGGGDFIKLEYDVNSHQAKWTGANGGDSVLVCYRTLSYDLSRRYYNRNVAQYDTLGYYRDDPYYNRQFQNKREELFTSPGINKSGTISRGISVGNNQSVFVNSVLNLQIEGKLTDDVSIIASISDQNVPFQPEGNTQQIQQFDKVYVQLRGKKLRLTAGDFVLQSRKNFFLKYYRNVQGGWLEYDNRVDSNKVKSYTSVGVAVSKGKFNTMEFGPGQADSLIEGVQGPYRLRGPNNERFITVLANSESIYVDGRLLTRGFDFDYVIDYNQAEIIFTPKVIITRYTRMRVDFEYSDRNYARTTMQATHSEEFKEGWVYLDYFSEKDNPNKPINVSLSDQDKLQLSLIGDSIDKAYVSGVDSVGYSTFTVLYKKTKVGLEDVYVYSTSPDSAFFQLKFTKVPLGQGRYVQDTLSTVNGKVYKYVGLPNGDYEPVQLIPTPKQKRMIVLGGGVNVSKSDVITAEVAFSRKDPNLYSPIDNNNNNGIAAKVGYENKGKRVIKDYNWVLSTNVEYDQKQFTTVDRIRLPDFERNWNEDASVVAENFIADASTGLYKNETNKVIYKFIRRVKGTAVDGSQQELVLNKSIKNYQVKSSGFLTNNNNRKSPSNWHRIFIDQYYTTRYIVPGVVYSKEYNAVRDSMGNITSSLMNFEEMKGYIKSNDTLKVRFFVNYAYRTDYEVFKSEFAQNSIAQTVQFGAGGVLKKNHDLNALFTYRGINTDVGPTPVASEENLTGRVDWNASLFKRHVRSEITLTTGTGRELKKQYVFQPVASGLGNYVWQDFNKNGLQEINEFVTKVYNDTLEYIKVFVPTDTYTKVYSSTYNQRIDITAPRMWRDSESVLKKLIARLSNVSSWQVSKQIIDDDFAKRFIPFVQSIDPSKLLSFQQVIRSTFFYNRSNPKYGIEGGVLLTNSKLFLNQGFSRSYQREWNGLVRYNISSTTSMKLGGVNGLKSNYSDFLLTSNYEIYYNKINPEFSFQPRNTFRLTFLMGGTFKNNKYVLGSNEKAELYNGGIEVKLNKLSQRSITTTLKYIRINAALNGTPINSPVGYELLEALLPGNNFTWNITWQEKLMNGLQFSFSYEGRQSEKSKIVHIGRMNLSALF